jgi:hypothetical protein
LGAAGRKVKKDERGVGEDQVRVGKGIVGRREGDGSEGRDGARREVEGDEVGGVGKVLAPDDGRAVDEWTAKGEIGLGGMGGDGGGEAGGEVEGDEGVGRTVERAPDDGRVGDGGSGFVGGRGGDGEELAGREVEGPDVVGAGGAAFLPDDEGRGEVGVEVVQRRVGRGEEGEGGVGGVEKGDGGIGGAIVAPDDPRAPHLWLKLCTGTGLESPDVLNRMDKTIHDQNCYKK